MSPLGIVVAVPVFASVILPGVDEIQYLYGEIVRSSVGCFERPASFILMDAVCPGPQKSQRSSRPMNTVPTSIHPRPQSAQSSHHRPQRNLPHHRLQCLPSKLLALPFQTPPNFPHESFPFPNAIAVTSSTALTTDPSPQPKQPDFLHTHYCRLRLSHLAEALTRLGMLRDYVLIDNDYFNDYLIEAFSPVYDDPASGLPLFAVWTGDNDTFFMKIRGATLMMVLRYDRLSRESRRLNLP